MISRRQRLTRAAADIRRQLPEAKALLGGRESAEEQAREARGRLVAIRQQVIPEFLRRRAKPVYRAPRDEAVDLPRKTKILRFCRVDILRTLRTWKLSGD